MLFPFWAGQKTGCFNSFWLSAKTNFTLRDHFVGLHFSLLRWAGCNCLFPFPICLRHPLAVKCPISQILAVKSLLECGGPRPPGLQHGPGERWIPIFRKRKPAGEVFIRYTPRDTAAANASPGP